MAICSCSSWSERPSNWRRGGEEDNGEDEEEEEGRDMEEGERNETPNKGNPVDRLWRRQRAIAVSEKARLKVSHLIFTLMQWFFLACLNCRAGKADS